MVALPAALLLPAVLERLSRRAPGLHARPGRPAAAIKRAPGQLVRPRRHAVGAATRRQVHPGDRHQGHLVRSGDEAVLRRLVEERKVEAGAQAGADVSPCRRRRGHRLARQGPVRAVPAGRLRRGDRRRQGQGRPLDRATRAARGMPVRTDLVPESERPKAWSDLADPRYRGRMVMADPQASAIALAVVGALAQRLGWDFVQGAAHKRHDGRARPRAAVQGDAAGRARDRHRRRRSAQPQRRQGACRTRR